MNKKFLISILALIIYSCSLPKETQVRLSRAQRDTLSIFPLDYCLTLPELNKDSWNDNYTYFDKFKTNVINRTQIGITFTHEGIKHYFCYPSANPYTQMATSTMIKDDKAVVGEWRIINSRTITFEDSTSNNDDKIYRTIKEIKNDKDNDFYLLMTGKRMKFYNKSKENHKFKHIFSKNYCIVSKRYLMVYGLSKAGAAINFIGLDSDGRLILDTFFQEERTLKDKYIVFHATMIQYIFEKFK